jgi:hypothetical protein
MGAKEVPLMPLLVDRLIYEEAALEALQEDSRHTLTASIQVCLFSPAPFCCSLELLLFDHLGLFPAALVSFRLSVPGRSSD